MTKPPLDLEIHINEDGEIVLTELPEDLAQMVAELDPEHPLTCAINRGRELTSPETNKPPSKNE